MAASTQSKKNEALGRRGREDEGDSPEDDDEAAAPNRRGLSFRKRAQAGEAAETEEPEQLKKRSMLQRAVDKGKAKVAEGAEEGVKDEAKEVAKEAIKEERKKWVI